MSEDISKIRERARFDSDDVAVIAAAIYSRLGFEVMFEVVRGGAGRFERIYCLAFVNGKWERLDNLFQEKENE